MAALRDPARQGRGRAAFHAAGGEAEGGVQREVLPRATPGNTTTARRPPACCRWRSAWFPTDQRERVFDHLVEKITDETQRPHRHRPDRRPMADARAHRPTAGRTWPTPSPRRRTTRAGATWWSKGATTIWELWNGDTADPAMNSGNHVMLVGDLGIWLYENLAGIKPDPEQPGFKHIIMRPTPVRGDLTFCEKPLPSWLRPTASLGSPLAMRERRRRLDWVRSRSPRTQPATASMCRRPT